MPAASDWAVLFVQSPSPGAVFRFLERRRPANAPEFLFLSDALSADGWRALPGERDFLTAQALPLSRPFPPLIYLLYRETDCWGWASWENGEEKERFESALPPSQTMSWKAFFGIRTSMPPPLAWAQTHGLPLSRVPGALSGAKPVPIIEYRTVSGLDQRDLLLETKPRLYRFGLGSRE